MTLIHKNNHQYLYLAGPIKIRDGLFLGDQIAIKDFDFITTNKISHIINTVNKRIPNIWQKMGVQYLSFNWTDNQTNIFDKKNVNLNNMYQFIEQATQLGQSCLIHSVNGKSRSSTVIAAYLMKKYLWSLQKTMQFIRSKKEPLEIRQNFYNQLSQLQLRLKKNNNFSQTWQQIKNDQDLVMRNTFINSKNNMNNVFISTYNNNINTNNKQGNKNYNSDKKIVWAEQNKFTDAVSLVSEQKKKIGNNSIVKSILKFSNLPQKTNKQIKNNNQNSLLSTSIKVSGNILLGTSQIKNSGKPISNISINNFFNNDTSPQKNKKNEKNISIRPQSSDPRPLNIKNSTNTTLNSTLQNECKKNSSKQQNNITTRIGKGYRLGINTISNGYNNNYNSVIGSSRVNNIQYNFDTFFQKKQLKQKNLKLGSINNQINNNLKQMILQKKYVSNKKMGYQSVNQENASISRNFNQFVFIHPSIKRI